MGSLVRALFTLMLAGACASAAHAAPTYFHVAEPTDAREKSDDMAHARALVAKGREVRSPIVFAEIIKSSDGHRRDLDPDEPAWSRQISRFNKFDDFGIELVDGWPTQPQQNFDEWIRATGEVIDPRRSSASGNIGFWNYTVVAELRDYSPAMPPMASIPLPGALGTGLLTMGVAGFGWMTLRGKWRRAK